MSSSTADSVPKEETTAISPISRSRNSSVSIVWVPTPAKRSISASASAWVKAGETSITSRLRATLAMTQLPHRHFVVRRLLVDRWVGIERTLGGGRIDRVIGREAVEAAAPHEQQLVEQHVADRLDLAGVAGLAENSRRGIAAAVAKAREVDLDETQPLKC